MTGAGDIARMLAAGVDQLVDDLLPGGHREGHEWRCGSVAGEAGHSLGVHLVGTKAGIWSDFAAGIGGDALDLVRHCLGLEMADALDWSRKWLGLAEGEAELRQRRSSPAASIKPAADPDRWRKPWANARPIAGTIAETYLRNRGLHFKDPRGDFEDRRGEVLRFARSRARLSPDGELEHHPALLALLRDVHTGEPVGIHNIYLQPRGIDRIRDPKGKTTTGRVGGAAVMLDAFEDVTYGLTIAEGIETAIAVFMAELPARPVWALCGAGNLAKFPVLPVIEALTVAADTGEPGQKAAAEVAARWEAAGREPAIITPRQHGDWADPRKATIA